MGLYNSCPADGEEHLSLEFIFLEKLLSPPHPSALLLSLAVLWGFREV